MAKVKLALKALDEVLDGLPDHIAKLKAARGSDDPPTIELELWGSIAIDKDGGVDVGGDASAPNIVDVTTGGVPVSVKAGFGSKWDNQGGAGWKIGVKFT